MAGSKKATENEGSGSLRRRRILAAVKLLLLIFVLAGIPLILYLRWGDALFGDDAAKRIISYLVENRSISALLLLLMQIIQVIVCILPGQPIQFASSYMFGIVPGFLLSITGAVIGTVISFFLARVLGRDAVELFFGKEKVADYDRKLNSGRGLMICLLIYLIPGIPKDLVSYVAGISGMRLRPFILVSTIGRSPGMLGSLLLGHFFGTRNYSAIVVLSVVVALILIVCFIKRDRLMALLDDIEQQDIQREMARDGKKTDTED